MILMKNKYDGILGWHIAEKPEGYETLSVHIDSLTTLNDLGLYDWLDNRENLKFIKEKKAELEPQTPVKPSEYIGEVKKRIEVEVKLVRTFGFETNYGYMNIHKFEDNEGNILVWKTTTSLWNSEEDKPFEKGKIKATIKEHSTYNDEKQTVITRCKIA